MPPVLDVPPVQPARRCNAARLVFFVVVLLGLSGCGASKLDEPPIDGQETTQDDVPRVADQRFDGEFVASTITADGQDFTLQADPIVIIETEFGSLTINPGCNTYFGSFSLLEDGTASFTIAGGSQQDCGGLAQQEDAVLAAFAGVDSWTVVDGGFRFDGADGSAVTLLGP